MSEEFLSRLDKQAREWAEGRHRTKRVALWMAIFLAVGTVLEYGLAITIDRNLPIMIAINIAEAAAILWFFMHVRRAWRSEEH
jgi:hypothetical protein